MKKYVDVTIANVMVQYLHQTALYLEVGNGHNK